MTDIFNEIYTDIATSVRTEFPGVFVTGIRLPKPPVFPCVMITEADNYEDSGSIDNTLTERITNLMYEITVYSNLESGKREQCISILSHIDGLLKTKNFNRIARAESYFDSEATIYAVLARYRVKTDGTYLYTF